MRKVLFVMTVILIGQNNVYSMKKGTKKELKSSFKSFLDDNKAKLIKETSPDVITELLCELSVRKTKGKNIPHIILLHGPHGTGKSTIGTLIAKELKMDNFYINVGHLGNEYQNSTMDDLRKILLPFYEKKYITSCYYY